MLRCSSDSARSALDGHILLGLGDEHGGDELRLVPARRLDGHVLDGGKHGDHLRTLAGDHPLGDKRDGVQGDDGRLIPARLDDCVLLDHLDGGEHGDHLQTPAGDHPLGEEQYNSVQSGDDRLQGKEVFSDVLDEVIGMFLHLLLTPCILGESTTGVQLELDSASTRLVPPFTKMASSSRSGWW